MPTSANDRGRCELLTGGKPVEGKGSFYEPTVLSNIPTNSPAYRENYLAQWPPFSA